MKRKEAARDGADPEEVGKEMKSFLEVGFSFENEGNGFPTDDFLPSLNSFIHCFSSVP